MWGPQDQAILKALKGEGYRNIEYLASGGMSWIYRTCGKEKGSVCLKLLSAEEVLENSSQRQELYQRFKQERDILFSLDYPHIVQAKAQGYIEAYDCEIPFYTMEYCEGGSLAEILEKSQREGIPFSTDKSLEIFVKVACAVAYLHGKGYVHRDIKPQNILFATGEPKLADLGLAKNPRQDITRRGDELGTPAYLAPEQRLGQEADQRADIYALGLVLYEMLQGEIFYRQSTSFSQKMAPLAKKHPKIARLCYKMLAPRDMRLQSMQEVVDSLDVLEQGTAPSKLWFWKQNRRYKKRFQELESYLKQTRRGLEIIVGYMIKGAKGEDVCAEMQEKLSSLPPHLVAQEIPYFLERLSIPQLEALVRNFCKFNYRWLEEMISNISVSEKKKSASYFLTLLFLIEPENQKLWKIIRSALQGTWGHRKLNALWKMVHGPNRASAAEQLDFSPALPALIWALDGHGHWKTREAAAKNLAAIGPLAAQAVPALRKNMNHEQWHLRKAVVEALAAMGEHATDAVPELMDALKDGYPEVREAATQGLGMVGAKAQAAMPTLIENVKDAGKRMRKVSIAALGKIKAKQAVPELIQSLRDEDDEIRREASIALGSIGPAARASISRLKEIIANDEQLTRDRQTYPTLHETAEMALIEIGEISEYIEALQNDNWKLRWTMSYVLGQLKAQQAVPELGNALGDECWQVRENVAWALGKIGHAAQQITEKLTAALKDEHWKVRAAAARALGRVMAKQAIPQLKYALKDNELAVRHNAARAIEQIEHHQ